MAKIAERLPGIIQGAKSTCQAACACFAFQIVAQGDKINYGKTALLLFISFLFVMLLYYIMTSGKR